MCILSGEYAYEKTMSDKIFIEYAPTTTYNNGGQPTKRNKQITCERRRAFRTRMYLLQHLPKVPYGRQRRRRYNFMGE